MGKSEHGYKPHPSPGKWPGHFCLSGAVEIFLNGAASDGATLGDLPAGLLMFKAKSLGFLDVAHG
jgi:hypothetical protein